MSVTDGLFADLEQERAAGGGSNGNRTKLAAVLASLFEHQRAFVLDAARRLALKTPRRSGKTTAAAAKFIAVCLSKDNAECLFTAPTAKRAKRILWRELKRFNRVFALGIDFNATDGLATFPNGSTIALGGAGSMEHVDTFRGDGYDLVICDECASYDPDVFEYLLEEVIEPGLLDRDGALAVIGTPGPVLMGRFYDTTGPVAFAPSVDDEGEQHPPRSQVYTVTGDCTAEYRYHAWTLAGNTARPGAWARALRLKKRKGWTDQTPKWRREYLGEWCSDASAFVYPYDDERNGWVDGTQLDEGEWIAVADLPKGHDWRFVCGADPGFVNRFAVQVGAYSDTHPWMFQVYEFSRSGLSGSQMAAVITRAEKLCGAFEARAQLDSSGGGSAALADTINRDFGVATEAAKKSEKRDHIELVVGDLLDGRMKLMRKSRLVYEMRTLPWQDPLTKRHEKRDCPNDCCDAWLYLRRLALHWLAEVPAEPPAPGTAAHQHQLERERMRMDQEEIEAADRRHDPDAADNNDGADPWNDKDGDPW